MQSVVLGVKISDCLWYGTSSVKYLRPLKNSFISHFSFSNYLNVVYKIAEILLRVICFLCRREMFYDSGFVPTLFSMFK